MISRSHVGGFWGGVVAVIVCHALNHFFHDRRRKRVKHITIPNMPHLPQFSHATVCGDIVHISGCIGLEGDTMQVVEGGIEAETTAALHCVRRILENCGRGARLLKVNVYIKGNSKERFMEMNNAYSRFFEEVGWEYCARITVGCGALALGAQVEIDAVATTGV